MQLACAAQVASDEPVPQPDPRPQPEVPRSPADSGDVPQVRGVFVTAAALEQLGAGGATELGKRMQSYGIDTVFLTVYSGGTPLWPSRAYQAAGGQVHARGPALAEVVAELRPYVRVIAWFEYGFMVGPPEHPLARRHPDWLQRDRDGSAVSGEQSGFVFLSPAHPEAVALLDAMVAELADPAVFGFQGVCLDRYRWTRKTTKGREFGYEPASLDRYVAARGQPRSHDDADWVAHRERLVNDAVRSAYRAVKQVDPELLVCATPVGYYGVHQHMQRWEDWLRAGVIDAVYPQVYTNGTALSEFEAGLGPVVAAAARAGKSERLGISIKASGAGDADFVEQQIARARAQKVESIVFWAWHPGFSVEENLVRLQKGRSTDAVATGR